MHYQYPDTIRTLKIIMMKTNNSIFFILPVLILLASCENAYWNCLRGNGTIEQETRELADYTGVVSEGEFELFYVPDTSFYVILETDQNLLPYIRTRISGSTLIVDNGTRKCLRSEYPIRVYVHLPMIRMMSLVGSGLISAEAVSSDELELYIEGSGVIDVSGIDVEDLSVLITGSGDVKLYGEALAAEYVITGSGTIDARNVVAENCLAEIEGSGSIYCHAVSRLDAIISGSGSIYYKGSPSVSTQISGSGSVKSID
jgi:hypothetical protein